MSAHRARRTCDTNRKRPQVIVLISVQGTGLREGNDRGPLALARSLPVADAGAPMRESAEHYALPAHRPQANGQDGAQHPSACTVGDARYNVGMRGNDRYRKRHSSEFLDGVAIKGTRLPDFPNGPARELAANKGEPILALVFTHKRSDPFNRNRSLLTWGSPRYTAVNAVRTIAVPWTLTVH